MIQKLSQWQHFRRSRGWGFGGTWKEWHQAYASALGALDLYGDYLRPRGGRAPVASLVRLLPLRLSTGPGYLLTPKAARRLDEAAARIYRTNRITWEGTFDLIVLDAPGARPDRLRLAQNLAFLGYGNIDDHTWVATRPAQEVENLLAEAGLRYERFTASHAAGTAGATALVRRAWNLDEIGAAYEQFVHELRPVVNSVTDSSTDEQAYSARFRLVHAWRTFLFRDPQLPPALLPDRSAGLAHLARRRTARGPAGHARRPGYRPAVPGGRTDRGRPGLLRRAGSARARQPAGNRY